MIPYLTKRGSKVSYYEPTGEKKNFNYKKVKFVNNLRDACKKADLLIIHTEWNEFKQLNFKKISNKKNYKIYDLRNLYSPTNLSLCLLTFEVWSHDQRCSPRFPSS